MLVLGGASLFAAIFFGERALHAGIGDIDPASAAIALFSLLLTIVSTFRTVEPTAAATATDDARLLADTIRTTERDHYFRMLGHHDHQIALDFTAVRPAPRPRRQEELAEYFQRLDSRALVITGPAGAGKTLLAVRLIRDLLAEPGRPGPIPVRLSAATLETGTDTGPADPDRVREWLLNQLAGDYRLNRKTAARLVEDGRILPVVDGLDEMDATARPGPGSRAGRAIELLDLYLRRHPVPGLVVTCRQDQYDLLRGAGLGLRDAVQVDIRPIGASTAIEFITARVADRSRWQPVLKTIHDDPRGPLASALSTPWRLGLAVGGYEQRGPGQRSLHDPAELCAATLDSTEKVRDRLLELFIPAAMVAAAPSPYRPEQVQRWLTELARHLCRQPSTTDLDLHELWKMTGRRPPYALILIFLTLAWLAAVAVAYVRVPAHSHLVSAILLILALAQIGEAAVLIREPRKRPERIDLGQLRRAAGLAPVLVGVVAGTAIGVPALRWGPAIGVLIGVLAGLGIALTAALIGAKGRGGQVWLEVDSAIKARGPRDPVRDDLVVALAYGAFWGVVIGGSVGLGLLVLTGDGLLATVVAVATGVAATCTTATIFGSLGCYYLATTLWLGGHRLPRRPGRFLDWAWQTGLIRVAGLGYQFRHRELQDYLARRS